MVDYAKRLVEVDEVLKYLSEENINKIPEDIRNLIKENKDKQYTWKFDETKDLKDQNLNRDTIIILSYLNMEYLLNTEQKELMEKFHEFNEKKHEEDKSKKYNSNDIFNNNNHDEEIKNTQSIQEQSMIEYKEQTWYQKIFSKILKIFKK